MNLANKFLSLFGIKLIRTKRIKASNKIITTIIGGFELQINKGSLLPSFLEQFIHYESTLPRLSNFINRTNPQFEIIDVGAYIGDTAALVRQKIENKIYSIEADPFFFQMLINNAKKIGNIVPIQAYLGSGNTDQTNHMNLLGDSHNPYNKNGIVNNKIQTKTLDSIMDVDIATKNIGLLKIDTDGYDFEIINGAKKLLQKTTPILYIEFDKKLLVDRKVNGIEELAKLKDNYGPLMVYDNYGHFLLSSNLENIQLIEQLYKYIGFKNCPIYYFDLILFPKNKPEIFNSFSLEETEYFSKIKE